MSRIGKMPVKVPSGVEVKITDQEIRIKGSKGELVHPALPGVIVTQEGNELIVTRTNEEKQTRAFHGTMRAKLANMIEGVSKGFNKRLEIVGVGYRANMKGKNLELMLGFSHPVLVEPMEGVEISLDAENKQIVIVSGVDKQKVGQQAAVIRQWRKPEPYKGKGIRYEGEYVRRKVGKAAIK